MRRLLLILVALPLLGASALPTINTPRRVALATTQTLITWPTGTDYLRVEVPTGETVYYEVGCTDGAALGTHYETWSGGVTYVRSVHALSSVCLAAASGTPTVALTPLVKGR